MGIHSGKFASIDGESTVKNWNVTPTAATQQYRGSNTKAGTGRQKGIKDWSGGYSGNGGLPVNMPGDIIAFKGFTAPDDDVSGAGKTWAGSAIIDQITVTWDWTQGAIIGYQTSFSGNGVLTLGDDTVADATAINADSVLDALPPTCGASGITAIDNVSAMSLVISAANQAYANAGTSGWINRKKGTIDWNLAITIDDNDPAGGPFAVNGQEEFQLFIDATDFWDLQFGRIKDFSGIQADNDSGAIVQYVVNAEMDARNDTGGTIGRVRVPGNILTDWWPAV